MKAMTVVPGKAGSTAVTEFDGPIGEGEVLVQGLAVGICGTDVEIVSGQYGAPPDGADRLVLGHRSAASSTRRPTVDAQGDLTGGQVVGGKP